MQLYAIFLALYLCFASYTTTFGNKVYDNGTINFSPRKASEFKSSLKTTFDDEGLGPWYSLANSFIGTVLNKDPWPLAGKGLNEGIGKLDIQKDVIEGYAIGMIVTLTFGILFCLLMPIVGFCFCCCRCCGNCGGEMTQKDSPRNGCKRAVFGVILAIITLLMFAGVLLTFVCNDNLSKTLDKAKQTSSGIVSETSNFINETLASFDNVVNADLPFTLRQLEHDVSDDQLKKLVGDPFVKLIDDTVGKPIEAVSKLAENSKKMENQLDVITNNTDFLQSKANELEKGLNDTTDNITAMQTDCGSITPSISICDAISGISVSQGANFNNLPNVTQQLDSVRKVTQQDFVGSAEKGLQEVRDIPETMINKTRDTRKDLKKMIDNATTTFNNLLADVRKSADKTVLDPLKDMRKQVHDGVDIAKEYDRYRWYGGVGLTCILLLIVVLMALGLMCGICGHDKHATPSNRGTVSNMGGNCLMAATGFCFIFASFLMLLTTICFLIGAPMQGIVCEPIQSGKLFSEFLDNKQYFDPLLLNKLLSTNKTDIKIGESLNDCRANKPAYTALHLDSIFNISEKLNIKRLLGDTVDQQFESLNVNLTDQTILTNDSKKSLRELNSSGVESINFAQFTNETRKGITTQNLTELANTLDVFADNMTSIKSGLPGGNQTKAQSIIDRARATAAALRILDKDTVQAMASKANELDQNVVELKKIGGNLNDDATKTLKAAEEAETALHGSANKVKTVITNYKDRVLGYGFQFTAHILHLVTHELGRCKPLTNIFDAVVVLACEDFLMPFNGFWLAIGFCLFFFIPAIIFSVKLAKHYRRMKYESDFDDYDGHDMMEMGQPVGQEKKLWANPKGYSNGTRQ